MSAGTNARPAVEPAGAASVLDRLGPVRSQRGFERVVARSAELQLSIAADLARVETELARLPRGSSAARRSAHHLLDLGGKRLRPICVALAARLGSGFGPRALELAVAVELIHDASLLHDDVIDVGQRRRGAPTARVIHGNAASVIGGNWLLVTALERVQRAGVPGMVGRTLETLQEMIEAEALQLDHRGRADVSAADYFRIIGGKTASLFRWALLAGARAGRLSEDACAALERFGGHLGVAFQLVDDVLDYTGDANVMGKAPFNDLREGKMTYPLLLALERDPSLRPFVDAALKRPADRPLPAGTTSRVLGAIDAGHCVRDCLARARDEVRAAVACLGAVPRTPARSTLARLAEACVHRAR